MKHHILIIVALINIYWTRVEIGYPANMWSMASDLELERSSKRVRVPSGPLVIDYLNQCEEAVRLANSVKFNFDRFNRIIFAGMGGSGIAGDLVKDVLSDSLEIPLEVSKGYTLPAYADSNTLFICTSYSGNTEETLTQFVEAVKRKCNIISVTSGGKLLEWSKKLNLPIIQLPTGYQPRDTLPYQFFALVNCLEKLGLKSFSNDVQEFLELIPKIDLSQIDKIAENTKDSILVLYGSSEFSGVLKRIKSQINENCKMLAKCEELPELNHNEIVSYELVAYPNVSVIFLRDNKEKPEIQKRIEVTKEIIKDKVKEIHEIWSYGNSKLAKVMSLVYRGDYLSFKLAEIKKVNREQTKTIEKIKQELKSLNSIEKLEKELESF